MSLSSIARTIALGVFGTLTVPDRQEADRRPTEPGLEAASPTFPRKMDQAPHPLAESLRQNFPHELSVLQGQGISTEHGTIAAAIGWVIKLDPNKVISDFMSADPEGKRRTIDFINRAGIVFSNWPERTIADKAIAEIGSIIDNLGGTARERGEASNLLPVKAAEISFLLRQLAVEAYPTPVTPAERIEAGITRTVRDLIGADISDESLKREITHRINEIKRTLVRANPYDFTII